MILEIKTLKVDRTSPRARKEKKVIVYECDQCKIVFEGKYQKKFLTNRKFHLCSYECMGKSRSEEGVAINYQLQSRDMKSWHDKITDTLQKRYGVKNVSSLDWIKKKKAESCILHFGVDNPQKCKKINHRSLETRLKREEKHKTWISKPENKFRDLLNKEFGHDDVKIQCLIERKWSIDFYISSINTFVQFDGVYWHGLNRPIDVIKNSSKKQDIAIYEKWCKDRELDKYVVDHGLRLVRITDIMFRNDPENCIKIITNGNETK